jgi:hypothetical protein
MISPYCIPSRVSRLATAGLHALAGCLALSTVAAGQEAVSPARRLTGQQDRPVLPALPLRLRCDVPGSGLWAQGEAALGTTDQGPAAEAGFEEGTIALGARRELALLPYLSWTVTPELRIEATTDPHGLPAASTVNGSMGQELALSLPGNARLAAWVDLSDRLGGGAQMCPTLRIRASLAAQALVAGEPLRVEFQFTTTRTVGTSHGLDRPSACELAVTVTDRAPLRVAASCPGEAVQRLTLGISASF